MINRSSIIVFKTCTPPKTEFETTRDIDVRRNMDGSVDIRIISVHEGRDPIVTQKRLASEDAEAFGRALLCMNDDGFDAIIDRAAARDDDRDKR